MRFASIPAEDQTQGSRCVINTFTENIAKSLPTLRVKNEALKQSYVRHKKYGSKVHSFLEGSNAVTDFPILQHVVTTVMYEFSEC